MMQQGSALDNAALPLMASHMVPLRESHPRASVPHSCFWHSKAANSMHVMIEVLLHGSQPFDIHHC